MIKFKFAYTNEMLIPNVGLGIVGNLLEKTNLDTRLNLLTKGKTPTIKNSDIVRSYLSLLCQGKPQYEYLHEFKDTDYLKYLMNIKNMPSAERLRQRLDELGENDKIKSILKDEICKLIKKTKATITPSYKNYIPLDIDVSPHDNSDTKKEGLGFTYKKMMGFAPIYAYLGKEGYCVNIEFRKGNQHCQKGTPDFLKETIANALLIEEKPENIVVRMDSGNDAGENIDILEGAKVNYIIKRNLRKENLQVYLIEAKEKGEEEKLREGKVRYVTDKEVIIKYNYKDEGEDKTKEYRIRMVNEVIEKTMDRDGQLLLESDIKVNSFWTHIMDAEPKDIVELYHQHGTSEQFHSEIKTDLDLERLPSGKFKTNDLVLHLGIVAYNLLKLIGQEIIKKKDRPVNSDIARKRVRTVIQDIILKTARFVKHARNFFLKFASYEKWMIPIKRVYEVFST